MEKVIKVVGAVIENENNEILCALRSPKMNIPNYWEFPGGKVEKGEDLSQAIVREIKEELDCDIECLGVFNDNTHQYENFTVNLITMKCRIKAGVPKASEHEKLIWLRRECLTSLIWAPADVAAVRRLTAELL